MAPSSRLEEKLRKLGLSSDDGASSSSTPASKTKYTFRVYFPQPPYDGLQFSALKSGAGYNFTGQLLGVGGKQLQRIKQESSARVEVVNAEGNLNGAHPDPLDPDLHALISADSMGKLQKAATMVWELLQPLNAKYAPLEVVPGGSCRLTIPQSKAAASKPSVTPTIPGQARKIEKVSNSQLMPGQATQQTVETPSAGTLSRPHSVSPQLTPVTPAATAGRPGSFAANHSSAETTPTAWCKHHCNSPAIPDFAREHCSNTANSSSNSSSRSLFSSLEGFSLGPSAVAAAVSKTPVETEANTFTEPPAKSPARGAAVTQRRAAVSEPHPLQPPTPGTDAGCSSTAAENSVACQRRSKGIVCTSSCCLTLPTELMQDLGIAADEAEARTVSSSMAGAPPSQAGGEGCLLSSGSAPTCAQHVEPHPEGALVSSCSSCFQYGLGLCSTDGGNSCNSPALQALIADHRQQQQLSANQMQAAQHQGKGSHDSSPGVYDPMGFQSPLIGSLVGSIEGDGFSLGPSALSQNSGTLSRLASGHLSSSMLPPACTLNSYSQHLQLQEHQHMLGIAASESMIASYCMSSMGCGPGLGSSQHDGPAAVVLPRSLPGSCLSVSTSDGIWGAAVELPQTPMLYGIPGAAAVNPGSLPTMHMGSMMGHHVGMSRLGSTATAGDASAWQPGGMLQAQQSSLWSQEQSMGQSTYSHSRVPCLQTPEVFSSIW